MGLFTPGKKSLNKYLVDKELDSKLRFLNTKAEEHDIEKLKTQVENLSLICKALWEFIRENQNLSEDDLIKKIEKIKDIKEKTENCPKCGRIMNLNQNKCLYCGTPGSDTRTFD